MIRASLTILIVAAAAVAALALTGDAGRASVVWLGWRADMTAAVAVLIVLFGALLTTVFWRTLLWILAAPQRAARARAEARRRQANDTLTRGFLAAAAGDGSEARRLAQKAADLADETPGLVRILAAQAAEAAGDAPAAQAAYTAMLGFPDMRLAGHKGLMQLALAQGERETALRHAQEAFSETRSARWAWRALLEARLSAAEWSAGLELVKNAADRKIVPPVTAERARAALLAALAAQLSGAPEPKARGQALDSAVEAAKLQPGFAPGVVMAARLLAEDGKLGRATAVLENAWKAAPHPALWLAFRDLKTNETPAERARRLTELAAQNPSHRESRILGVERALIVGDAAGAGLAMAALDAEPVTARIAGLRARVAYACGQPDEARLWLAQGMNAPPEPDWSDLDPEGRAFAYQTADWARLVITYAETGELIHPRHERRERTLSELPELPIAYADAAAFLSPDGGAQALFSHDEQGYEDEEAAAAEPAPAPGRRRRGASRLASAPRAAK
ncbi:MAG TPA: heme biosynthesis HemY N-terminal domain-containing protein [Phenylobacterium sp.]|jgi:HemY protein|uniref:heme biosynthesis HemY N-terminal domain-containing protein n=1 Tax=Phenylobacterium sp. TaxID=1871053 RepID=UPI002C0993B8|nr:heme biosynthesis HemY N-terminal domain-containing protein [Phenylobacterium sp.]HXA39929.1 heme biosynthesis HemY N-terminal domain-containing protein [Phenylobacterium sp.]